MAVGEGVGRLDAWKPGSGRLATFRVPADVADLARLRAGEACRVQASEFTRADVYGELERGADELARHGGRATSRVFQTARASGKAAAASVVIGAAFDARKLWRKELTRKHFAARRGIDAVEGAATATVTSGAVVATTSAATAIVTAGGTGVSPARSHGTTVG